MKCFTAQKNLNKPIIANGRVLLGRPRSSTHPHAAARNVTKRGGSVTVAAEGDDNGTGKDGAPSPKQEKLVKGELLFNSAHLQITLSICTQNVHNGKFRNVRGTMAW